MSKLLWFLTFIVIAGCSVNTLFTTEKFTFYENDIKVNYRIQLPQSSYNLIATGHSTEYRYYYKDSSLIYVSDEKDAISPNYYNINAHYPGYRFSNILKLTDTMIYEGIDSLRHHWKEIQFPHVTVGYKNVQPEIKNLFDSSISTFRKR